MTLGSMGQVSSCKNSWKQKAPITSFQISKSSAIITAFKMSLERYLWPTEWTDSKTLNERALQSLESQYSSGGNSSRKYLYSKRTARTMAQDQFTFSAGLPKWQRVTILLILSVDWERRSDMAAGQNEEGSGLLMYCYKKKWHGRED